MIEKKDIEQLAKLARIDVSETEKEKLAEDLQRVLVYVKTLQEADTEDELFTHFEYLTAHVRDDMDVGSGDSAADLIAATPAFENGYIKVKSILEK